jgi:hypothetical protein
MNEHSTCSCGGGWTFDFQARRVYCRTCEERTLAKMRYCGPCDKWVPARETECKACGAPTDKAD